MNPDKSAILYVTVKNAGKATIIYAKNSSCKACSFSENPVLCSMTVELMSAVRSPMKRAESRYCTARKIRTNLSSYRKVLRTCLLQLKVTSSGFSSVSNYVPFLDSCSCRSFTKHTSYKACNIAIPKQLYKATLQQNDSFSRW